MITRKKENRILILRKVGMTSFITSEGQVLPATVLKKIESDVIYHKHKKELGYDSTIVGYDISDKINRAKRGFFKKNKKSNFKHLIELRDVHLDTVNIDDFEEGNKVKIRSKTKGRGFSGTIKRHNFRRGPMTHGSKSHRIPGSIGQCSTPSKVMKGKKMAGQYGFGFKIQSTTLLSVNKEIDTILVKGSCPGSNGSYVYMYGEVENSA